jgi:hypothetical protein
MTIWRQSGVPARELAEREGTPGRVMSLDVYSHVMPPDEGSIERIMALFIVGQRWETTSDPRPG